MSALGKPPDGIHILHYNDGRQDEEFTFTESTGVLQVGADFYGWDESKQCFVMETEDPPGWEYFYFMPDDEGSGWFAHLDPVGFTMPTGTYD